MVCIDQVKGFDQLYREQKDRGFTVLGVIIEDYVGESPTPDEVGPWAQELGLTHPVLSDVDGEFFRTYSTDPSNLFFFYVLERDGRIAWRERREDAGTLERVRMVVHEVLGP